MQKRAGKTKASSEHATIFRRDSPRGGFSEAKRRRDKVKKSPNSELNRKLKAREKGGSLKMRPKL